MVCAWECYILIRMISQIRGVVVAKELDRLIVDVNGVGYETLVSELDIADVAQDDEVCLHTYFHVRENAQELFGFLQPAAKQLFKQLITVNGVGPKGAMAIMALGEEKEIRGAIAGGNLAFLTAASGIGKKAAEKIVIDLKDKVGLVASTASSSAVGRSLGSDEAHEALLALGYSTQQANDALAHVDASAKVEDRIKQALKGLAR